MKSKQKSGKSNDSKKDSKTKQKSKKEKEDQKISINNTTNNLNEITEELKQKKPNIERYIYISSYSDVDLMSKLKHLFEEVNQTAFNFVSEREIYSYNLTNQEQDNNNIDYISGFQITDKSIRITILEGLTGKGIKRAKEILPKKKLNDNKIKILTNSNVLFDKRIYSKFNLSLKLIKLRHNLNKYLKTYTIYENANRFRAIYDCFQNLGSILRVETFEEVSRYKLFPTYESLLLIERKHGDMLDYQDITGVYKEVKKIKKSNFFENNSILMEDKNDDININDNINIDSNNNKNNNTVIVNKSDRNNFINLVKFKKKKINVSKSQGDIYISGRNFKEERAQKKKEDEEYFFSYQEKLKNIHKLIFKAKTNSKNEPYKKYLEEKKSKQISRSQIWDNNIKHIENLKKKIPIYKKFCRPCKPGEELVNTPGQILFCPTKRNYFDALVKKMREKYLKDKNHIYSYSNYSLGLSFPMIDTSKNEKYEKYLENKKKWKNNKDFERYKQPDREKIFFPRINNIF